MATIANLVVKIAGDSKQLLSEVGKAEQGISGMEKTTKKAAASIKFAFGVVATGAIGNMARTSIDAADKMGKLAARLGTTSEALSELAFVADRGGVSFNTLQMGLQRATRRIAEAANGTGEAVKALKELNLSARDLNQLAPEKQFEVIADAINNLSSSSDKVRLSMKLFDSEGVALIQTMQGGSKEIRALRQEARNLGATIGTDAAQSAAEFNDKMTIMEFKLQGLATRAAIPAAEAITDLINVFEDSGGKLKTSNDEFDGIKTTIKGVATAGIASTGIIAGLSEAFVGLAFAAKEIASGDLSGAMTELEEATRRTNEQFDLAEDRIIKLWETAENKRSTTPPNDFVPTVGGAGGGIDREEERQRQALERKIALIDESFLGEQQLINKQYEEKLADISRFESQKLMILTQNQLEKMRINDEMLSAGRISEAEAYEEQLRIIEQGEKDKERILKGSNDRKLKLGKQFGMNLLSDAAQYSRAAFNINKVAAIAEGIIKAKESVLGAYAFGSKIGGPPLGAAYAALAGVTAFGQLKEIANSQYGGGSTSQGISGGSVAVGSGETPIESNAANDEPQNKTVFINVEGIDDEAFLTKNQVRSIVDQINEERDANVRVVL